LSRRAAKALLAALIATGALAGSGRAQESVPTGVAVTPTAARGAVFSPLNPHLPGLPDFTAGQAASLALSPDRKTLLVLTSGFNRNAGPNGAYVPALSGEYVFVFDVAGGAPRQLQALRIDNSFLGLVWAPGGEAFYVSGGVDDAVLEFVREAGAFRPGRRFPLGHVAGLGIKARPEAAGIAVSPSGRWLLAANFQNDSVSLVDLAQGKVASELDLRPGIVDPRGGPRPGGGFPRALAFTSDATAFVGVDRDREILALKLGAGRLSLERRIPVKGQPAALLAGAGGRRLYAALDNTDGLAVLDGRTGRVLERIPTQAPPALLIPRRLGGVGTDSVALSADGKTALLANGGQNAVAVVRLSALAQGLKAPLRRRARDDDGDGDGDEPGGRSRDVSEVVGLIPTGWYPTGAALSKDGDRLYVINAKSNPGPNPQGCRASLAVNGPQACRAANQYVWQLEKAGFLTLPTPTPAELGALTQKVALNNHYRPTAEAQADAALMAALRQRIRHVVYIVKENRTYDQVLGDLEVGDGDPRLAILGRPLTPNHHALAGAFVDLDNFMDSGESSNTGWNWTTAGRTNDFTEREAPVNYAGRGLQYDQEGANRNVNVGLASPAARIAANPATPEDPNLLVGEADVAAPDGPGGDAGDGYLWNGALRAGLSLRNWGFYGDLSRYEASAGPARIPLERDPHAKDLHVFITTKAALRPYTDPYYRGFDQAFPDYWRYKEWAREFDGFVAKGEAPSLMLVRLPHDHFGSFAEGVDGLNSVETEIADNDYALGLIVETISKSPFAKDTLIFVVEDDAQDGPDHVNAHRSVALVAGPYVKKRAVISTRYTTVSMLRTIEEILGLKPLNLNDAMARPMSEVFDLAAADWSFKATASKALEHTALPIPREAFAKACPVRAPRSAAYWEAAMAGQDFSREDHLDTPAFNAALWRGLAPGAPEPTARSGENLRLRRPAAACPPAPG
jgi:DNA-binding beta-propeller fold protein YncE